VPLNASVQRGDSLVESGDLVEEHGQQETVVVCDPPFEGPLELGDLAAELPAGKLRQSRGIVLAADQCFDRNRSAG
jgi:23S rRNA A2030 N6-methylase RlmJ